VLEKKRNKTKAKSHETERKANQLQFDAVQGTTRSRKRVVGFRFVFKKQTQVSLHCG
jgi:hypothetical protein